MDLCYEIKKSYKKPLRVSLFQMGFLHFICLFLEKSTKKSSQGTWNRMMAENSSTTMPATILAATSLTGWGKLNTSDSLLDTELVVIANLNLWESSNRRQGRKQGARGRLSP